MPGPLTRASAPGGRPASTGRWIVDRFPGRTTKGSAGTLDGESPERVPAAEVGFHRQAFVLAEAGQAEFLGVVALARAGGYERVPGRLLVPVDPVHRPALLLEAEDARQQHVAEAVLDQAGGDGVDGGQRIRVAALV